MGAVLSLITASADGCRALAGLLPCLRGVCGVHWARHVTGPPPATLIPPLAPACEATRGRGGCVTLCQRVNVWAWRWQLVV